MPAIFDADSAVAPPSMAADADVCIESPPTPWIPYMWLAHTLGGALAIAASAYFDEYSAASTAAHPRTTAAWIALVTSPRSVLLVMLAVLLIDGVGFRALFLGSCFRCHLDIVQLCWLLNYSLVVGFTLSQMLNVFRVSGMQHEVTLPEHLAFVKVVRTRLIQLVPLVYLVFAAAARQTVDSEIAPFTAFNATVMLTMLVLTGILYLETEMREEVEGQGSRLLVLRSADQDPDPDTGKPDPSRPAFVAFKPSLLYKARDKLANLFAKKSAPNDAGPDHSYKPLDTPPPEPVIDHTWGSLGLGAGSCPH